MYMQYNIIEGGGEGAKLRNLKTYLKSLDT